MTVPRVREPFRARVQLMLRTAILDAAWKRAAEQDWSAVHVAQIADDVGVSRQTVYNEFGSKDDLAAAVVRRDLERFVAGLVEHTQSAPDLETAARDSMGWLLREARRHPIVKRTIEGARQGEVHLLTPFLTVRADALIVPVRNALVRAYQARWPHEDRAVTVLTVELMVRMVLSQLTTPSDLPEDALIDRMVAMMLGSLRTEPVSPAQP
jgi:AcrR family transcriptional regulator